MFSNLPNSVESFYSLILVQSIAALKVNTFYDNYDVFRFNADGSDNSKVFQAHQSAFYFDWFAKNHENLFSAYSQLNDDTSKRLFLNLIAFRLAGHFSVRLPVDFAQRTEEFEQYKATEKSTPSELGSNGQFGKLRHFDFEFENHRYIVDCVGLEWYLFRHQYFYQKSGVRICPAPGDTVIDGGACTGDTAAVFSNAIGPAGTVFCFDPVADHLAIMAYNVKQFPYANVKIMPFGLSDKNILSEPIVLNEYSPGFRPGNTEVPLRSIDFLVDTKEIPRIDFLKLDVEGAELDSLRGASKSIARFKPKLAISLYHKPNDIYELILYLKSKYPFYSCYLDHYTIHNEETVLYCIA